MVTGGVTVVSCDLYLYYLHSFDSVVYLTMDLYVCKSKYAVNEKTKSHMDTFLLPLMS